jgi:hypothetical protein
MDNDFVASIGYFPQGKRDFDGVSRPDLAPPAVRPGKSFGLCFDI